MDEEEPDTSKVWEGLVELVQYCWTHGELPVESTWMTLVLLPKADGGTRGIGLLDAVWKLIAHVENLRIQQHVTFHDSLHGFRGQRGTGTAIMEAKLFQQELAKILQVPTFEIFLDLKKAYDTLDQGILMEVLEGYGIGPNFRRLLQHFWDKQQIVAKMGGYHRWAFRATRGVTQGDPISPTLFNLVVDTVVRHWLSMVMEDSSVANDGLQRNVEEYLVLFYADDGLIGAHRLIGAHDNEWLQGAFNCLRELFERVGLLTKATKLRLWLAHLGSSGLRSLLQHIAGDGLVLANCIVNNSGGRSPAHSVGKILLPVH